ncbi:MAG TPA: hypothetical protein VJK02_08365 [Anaerolineales bacterium]|nr:hypothetical protein [Anaerolineales bacterium]
MRIGNPIARWRQRQLVRDLASQIGRVEAYLEERETPIHSAGSPILFFNASTRLHRLSLNAAFGLLASWALRAERVPIVHLVCEAGMWPCVLGTDRRDPRTRPPCSPCQSLSGVLFPSDLVTSLPLDRGIHRQVMDELAGKSLQDLVAWKYRGRPLGELCLPSVRWILRRHHLPDSEPVRSVYRGYLASAASLSVELATALSRLAPRAIALFNGIFYPEALAREIAREFAIPVVTHEVGLAPNSAFFTRGEASFRETPIVVGSRLGEEEDRELDRYLEDRFRGSFTMAGIRFWKRMEAIPEWLQEKRRQFRQTVAVFTNVVFDTSQVHANTIFVDMFAWLDLLVEVVERHPETLFVFRAHPDEDRPGKESQESVAAWFGRSSLPACRNAVFVEPKRPISSYELVRTAKLVLVYNSSVGLEASVLGVPVLCAGKARYTQVPSVFLAQDRGEYFRHLERFLEAERIEVPLEFRQTARAFLHAELFEASLDLSEFVEPLAEFPGMVALRRFEPERLLHSRPLEQIRSGFVDDAPFLLTQRSPSESGERLAKGAT